MIKDNEGIYPEIRESYAAAFQEREDDIMDCKDSEGVDIKQGDLNEPEIHEPLEFIECQLRCRYQRKKKWSACRKAWKHIITKVTNL